MYTFSDKCLNRIDICEDVLTVCKQFDLTLAGGALRGIFGKDEKIEDYDLFFVSNAHTPINQVGEYLQKLEYKEVFHCPNDQLITFKKDDVKIQLIRVRDYFSVKSMLDSFDINACRIAYYKDKVYTFKEAIRDIRKKHITLHDITYPSATFKRIVKYHDKGYYITPECITKYVSSVNQLKMKHDRFYVD